MTHSRLCLVVVSSLLLCAAIASAQLSRVFLPPVIYRPGGYSPSSVAIADVNGDGKLDLVVANQGENQAEGSVSILLGNGDGTYQSAVNFDSGGVNAYSLAVADLNGDGHPDVLVGNGCATGTSCASDGVVGVLFGNGDGTFQTPVTYSTGASDFYRCYVAVADLNADQKLDIVVANGCGGSICATGSVSVLLGDDTGKFGQAVLYPSGGAGAFGVAIADINGDGRLDLLTANWCASTCNTSVPTEGAVGILLGNGDGTFQTAVSYASGGNGTKSVSVSDVNRDTKLDVLTASCGPQACGPGFGGGNVGVLLGNGDGTLQTAVAYSAGNSPDAILAADLNGDGNPDLVVGNWGTSNFLSNKGSVTVLLGKGTGSFGAAKTFVSGQTEVPSIAVADLNSDGRIDVVTANAAAVTSHRNDPGSISVLLSSIP